MLAIPTVVLGEDEESLAALEAYKRRLVELSRQQDDPLMAARLKQMHRLLSMMQKSIVIEEAKADSTSARETPPVADPIVATPPPPEDPPAQEARTTDSKPVAPSPKLTPPIPVVSAKQAVPATPPRPSPTPPPVTPLKRPSWYTQAVLTTAFGYQENVLRSAFSDLDSSFLHGALDLQAFNMNRSQHRVAAFARYSRTHFLEEPDVRDEDQFFLFAQVDRRFHDDWWLGVTGSFFTAHQPFDDPSVIDLDGSSAPIKFTQLSLAPQLTWEPNKRHTFTVNGGYSLEESEGLEPQNEDNDQWFAGVSYVYKPVPNHQIRFDYRYTHLNYDDRSSRLSDGERLPFLLDLDSHELALSYQWRWQWQETRWRLGARARYLIERDHTGGYDDVNRSDFRARLQCRHDDFAVQMELRYGDSDYESRQISLADTSTRRRDYWSAKLEASYRIHEHAKLWLSYEHRENSGNRQSDRYRYQSLYTGFQFTF